jgi:hypothetical protein
MMPKHKLWTLCATLAATSLLSDAAFAAARGNVGATSKASLSINVSVPQNLTIRGARILPADDQRSTKDHTGNVEFCVEGRTSTGGYTVTLLEPTSQTLTWVHGYAIRPGSCATYKSAGPSLNALAITRANLKQHQQAGALILIVAAD